MIAFKRIHFLCLVAGRQLTAIRLFSVGIARSEPNGTQ